MRPLGASIAKYRDEAVNSGHMVTMESSNGRDASATDEGSVSATVVRPPPTVAFRPAPRVRGARRSTGEGGPASNDQQLSLSPRRRTNETTPGPIISDGGRGVRGHSRG